MRGWWRRIALASILAGAVTVASSPAKAEFGGYITGGVGAFDFLHDYTAAEGRLEFRFASSCRSASIC
jgi:hypothetical protein